MPSTVLIFSWKFTCADFVMFRQLVLMVLFRHLHGQVAGGAISDALGDGEVLLQDGVVAEMTVSVTFGASACGAQIDHICDRSEYAAFSTLSATGAREVTVSVTFGAPHFGFPVTSCRGQIWATSPTSSVEMHCWQTRS